MRQAGAGARDRRALQQFALNVRVKHSDLTMTGVRYNSLLWMCALNTKPNQGKIKIKNPISIVLLDQNRLGYRQSVLVYNVRIKN